MPRYSSIEIAARGLFFAAVTTVIALSVASLDASSSIATSFSRTPQVPPSREPASATPWSTRDAVVPHSVLTKTSAFGLQSTTAALSAPWTDQDIGSPALAGSSSESAGVFTISAAGADIWGSSDQFHFVYQPFTGDGEIVARVDSLLNTSAWAKAGVMIRESLTAGSPHAFALESAGAGSAFQWRLVSGGTSSGKPGRLVAPPRWVRLVRAGNTFSAYDSADGTTWQLIASQSIPMAATAYAGLAVTSHNATASTTASISKVTVTTGTVNQPPIVQMTSPANGASFPSPASLTITASASDPDGTIAKVSFLANGSTVGSLSTAPYSMSLTNVPAGTYTFTAVATDNLGAVAKSSAVTITVTQPTSTLAPPWASQDVGAPALAGTAVSTSTGISVQGAGADIWGSADQFQFVSQLLTGDGEIVARVDSILNTNSWAKAGVMLRESTSAGSKNALALVSAARGVAFQRRAASGGLTTSTAGTLSFAPRWLKLVRQGDTITSYQSPDGITWQVIGSDTVAMTSTVYAGLAVTSHNTSQRTTALFSDIAVTPAVAGNQPPTAAITAPVSGASYIAPATITVTAAASDPDGTVSKVDFYQGSTLIGTSSTSPYSVTWSNVAAGSYSLTAVATDNSGATTRSAAVSVTVTPAANQPPTVAITSPASGATFTAPATIPIAATASDSDGTVTKVDFYQGATLIGTATTSPYSITWSNVAAGSYSLTAVATDNSGATTRSAAVGVTVNPAANQPPTVSITSPVAGFTFGAPAVVSLSASASDPDGTVVRVDFYAGTALLGSSTASPYGLAWNALSPGTYAITAVAVDNSGAQTTSTAVSITANPTTAVFTASPDNNTLVTSYVLEVFPAGADPNTATPVARQDLGKPALVNGDITVDITATLQPLVPGSYIATVSALDAGGSSRSSPASFIR